jgi:hypothetical protein
MVPFAFACSTAASAAAIVFFASKKQHPTIETSNTAARIPTKTFLIRFFTSFREICSIRYPSFKPSKKE